MKPFLTLFCILISYFQAFSQNDPPIRSGELIKSAEEFYDSGQYKKSLSLYDQIDRNDSNYVRSLYGRALNYQADSQFRKAIQVCEEALQLKDKREWEPDIYNTYANVLGSDSQREKSISVFNEAIRKYPSYSLLYLNKGIALFEQNRFAEAESVFKETLLINPYQFSAHFYLGLCAIHEGKIVPAFFSFVGYLLIYPEGKYSKRCVNILSAISNATDEILDYKTKRKEDGDENYAAIEEILISKIALDKDYKLKVPIDDAIIRQIQVVFEKLEFKEDDPDFWMQYYAPYYKKIFNDGQFEPFIFWTFENVQLKDIQDYNKKNKKTIELFTTHTADYFNEIRATRLITYNKRAEQRSRYLYLDGSLAGLGELTPDGKTYLGSWTFYYPKGNIKSTGQFNEMGRYGVWTYYHFTGSLDARENYKNGKLDGEQLYYSEKGVLTSQEIYSNGLQEGVQKSFFNSGNLYSTTMYKAGKMDGEYKEYFSGGQISGESQYNNNVLSGTYTTYFNNGQIKELGNYTSGSLDGPSKEFYENGQLNTEGIYKKGANEGEWKTYFDNGKLKSRVNYVNKKQDGIEENFYEEGPLKTTYTYKNGQLYGESVSYDKDQKPYAKFKFSNNKLESAIYFDKTGKQISSSEIKNNRLEFDIFLADGTKTTHRTLNKNGEIDGTETSYYPSGKISEIAEYLDGEKNGLNTEYYQNGNKKSEQNLKNGKENGKFIKYFPNGQIEIEGWFVDGNEAGYWNYYNELGNLEVRNYMVNGVLSGYKTEYYPNGAKSIEKKIYKGLLEEMKQYDSTGKLLIYDSFPHFTGKFLLLYPDGKKMQECNYVNGSFEGPLTQYYFDGSLEFTQYYKGGLLDSNYAAYEYHNIKTVEGQYKAGKKTGLWKYYKDDGQLNWTENFAYNELNGRSQYFSNDRKIIRELMFRNDERDGRSTTLDPDGSILFSIQYDEGDVMGYSYLAKDGNPVPEIRTDHGKLQITSFFQNGLPSRKCQYVDNVLNGTDILYYSNGKLRSQSNLAYGLYEGVLKEYYPNGNTSRICNYLDDHSHGMCLEYNVNGVLIREINYYVGTRHGNAKYYSENGSLLETRYYYDGNLLGVKK
ncbi:MAG TPA: tetratricopeptide repeat protein [Puia sp.]|nr:tetratricopeptide repeat protein [Puia sp.]